MAGGGGGGRCAPLHRELVRARDELKMVRVKELVGDVGPEDVARAARRDAPSLDVVVGVGPHQVAHRTLMWRLLHAVEVLDLVDGVERRREAAMHA